MTIGEWQELCSTTDIDTTHVAHQLTRSQADETHNQLVCHINESPHLSAHSHAPLERFDNMPLKTTENMVSPLEDYVSLWLRFHGPVSVDQLRSDLDALGADNISSSLAKLAALGKIVRGQLIEGLNEACVCDLRNYEMILRRLRTHRSESFEPVPIELIALHTAQLQGLTDGMHGYEGLSHALEHISCYPAPAELWESDILPARIKPYDPTWIDRMTFNDELCWIGTSSKVVSMLHPVEIDLYLSEESPQSTVIPPGEGRYSFDALRRMTGLRSQTLHEKLWVETWAGAVTNDTLSPLRATILPGYRPPKMQLSENSRRRRRGQGRHEHSSAITGRWHHTPDKIDSTPMEEEELGKERVKLLLGHWHRLFRSLRLMELSGEVLSGPFYDNVRGLQFTTRENVTLLQNRDATPFWLNACDPSSICGLKCSNLKLPARRPANGELPCTIQLPTAQTTQTT
jgi:ATP-dependent Lhr-like helicase